MPSTARGPPLGINRGPETLSGPKSKLKSGQLTTKTENHVNCPGPYILYVLLYKATFSNDDYL